jgi:RNA polymerase sigma-B factor
VDRLDHEEARALLRAHCETGDAAARERLIELHLPLVRALARRYANCGERVEDLVQVGCIGLIEAIDRFDPERGSELASFAVPTILGEIKRHLRDRASMVRIPRRLAELNGLLRPHRASLAAALSRTPTLSELAREAGVGEGEAAEAIAIDRARAVVSFPVSDGAHGELGGAILVDDAFDSSDDRLLLAAGFRTLDDRERRILHLRYFAGLSQAEIACELGISRIHVSRLIRASLERLRGALGERHGQNGRPRLHSDDGGNAVTHRADGGLGGRATRGPGRGGAQPEGRRAA